MSELEIFVLIMREHVPEKFTPMAKKIILPPAVPAVPNLTTYVRVLIQNTIHQYLQCPVLKIDMAC